MAIEPHTTDNSAQITDDQLKSVVGGGLLTWLVLGLLGVPLLGGLGAVAAAIAGVTLFARSKRN